MPNAVIEAMAHGLPVVASDVGGVRSLLGAGAGLVVAPGDVRSLADALTTSLHDGEQRAALGARGAEIARGMLSIDQMCRATHEALDQLVAERARTRRPRGWVGGRFRLHNSAL